MLLSGFKKGKGTLASPNLLQVIFLQFLFGWSTKTYILGSNIYKVKLFNWK